MDPTFLTGANATFVAELYAQYLRDPSTVDSSWSAFFNDLGDEAGDLLGELDGASWAPSEAAVIGIADPDAASSAKTPAGKSNGKTGGAPAPSGTADHADLLRQTEDSIHALQMIRAYRARGHQIANLDPLKLQKPESHPELDPKVHGFDDGDMDREIYLGGVMDMERATVRHLLNVLKETYCGSIGVELTHIQDPDQKYWLQKRVESERNQTDFSQQGKMAILERLTEAEGFEKFLGTKYTGTKRFGLDGGEATVPAIEQILKVGGKLGIQQVVLGMAHRGRLNILVNVMHKPFTAIFSEFQGNSPNPDEVEGSGDVKYHLGTSADREFDGNVVHLSLTANLTSKWLTPLCWAKCGPSKAS